MNPHTHTHTCFRRFHLVFVPVFYLDDGFFSLFRLPCSYLLSLFLPLYPPCLPSINLSVFLFKKPVILLFSVGFLFKLDFLYHAINT